MKISFFSLEHINKEIEEIIFDSFKSFYKSNNYILGSLVKDFEKDYATFCGAKYCIGVSNGLDALHLSLLAAGVEQGDEVIVPSNTYIATLLAVTFAGAIPVFAEPRLNTFNIDPNLIAEKITPRTKAIIPVHLYGQPCEMIEILNIAHQHKLIVIEDNAQAQGAMYLGKYTGTFGLINATSFYPTKNLGAFGDAGAITTNDEDIYLKVLQLRNYGSSKKYVHEIIGYNNRLDELQAAFLLVKLKFLNAWNNKRNEIAASYMQLLKDIPEIELPFVVDGAEAVYHQFVIRTQSRNELKEYLLSKGIETLIHYPIPPHLQKAYMGLGFRAGSFPVAEELSNTVLSLPIYPGLQLFQVEYVCEMIRNYYKHPIQHES